MHYARLTIALSLAALTAACGKKAETPVAAETNQAVPATAAMSGEMGNMAMAPAASTAQSARSCDFGHVEEQRLNMAIYQARSCPPIS